MAEATFSELKAAFPRASAEFLVGCQARGLTLDAARAEHDEQMAKALDDKEKELEQSRAGFEEFKKNTEEEAKAEEKEKEEAEAKAKAEEDEERKSAEARIRSGVLPAGSSKRKPGQGAQSQFMAGVGEHMKCGLTRPQAVAQMVRDDPESHREFVKAGQP